MAEGAGCWGELRKLNLSLVEELDEYGQVTVPYTEEDTHEGIESRMEFPQFKDRVGCHLHGFSHHVMVVTIDTYHSTSLLDQVSDGHGVAIQVL